MGSRCGWKQPFQLSRQLNSFLISSFQHLSYDARWPSSLAASYFARCFVDLGHRHTEGGTSSWRDLRELIFWPHKLNIEQPSIVLNPCLHLVFVSECKLTNIIANTVVTNNVLFFAVHLFGDMENTTTIWGYCGESFFLHLRLCQPDGIFCA